MRHLVREAGLADAFLLESAGLSGFHVGQPPDARARAAARRMGIVVGGAARQFERGDFARFDHVIAMDRDNRDALEALAAPGSAPDRQKIRLLRAFERGSPERDVPDPYYGGERDFDEVLEICLAACAGLLAHVRGERGL